ncbi:MAG: hypothetical protein Q8873_04010 [Bacillota bacterium]|nr:hypothetical protein [Bacillota bacterium]
MAENEKLTKNITLYKNKPLVKRGNIIYLGYRDESFMIEMEITDTEKNGNTTSATAIEIRLIDNSRPGRDRVVKKAEREDIYKSIDIASFWLTDALGEEG